MLGIEAEWIHTLHIEVLWKSLNENHLSYSLFTLWESIPLTCINAFSPLLLPAPLCSLLLLSPPCSPLILSAPPSSLPLLLPPQRPGGRGEEEAGGSHRTAGGGAVQHGAGQRPPQESPAAGQLLLL